MRDPRRSPLHVGHVLDLLPALCSAAPDAAPPSAGAQAPSGGPWSPGQVAQLAAALRDAVLAAREPTRQLGGRLPVGLDADVGEGPRRTKMGLPVDVDGIGPDPLGNRVLEPAQIGTNFLQKKPQFDGRIKVRHAADSTTGPIPGQRQTGRTAGIGRLTPPATTAP